MKESRIKNSFYNVSTTLFEYVFKIVLVFITRTIFIKKLGTEFLGLDGLYTNILSIMSITELGLSGAIVYSLYKPLLEKDEKKINIIMHIYKNCYFCIGFVITIIGFVIIPFLPKIVNSSFDFGNIYILFLLYLIQTLSTYWVLAYKEAILIADQKKYKLVIISNVILLMKFMLQILSLLVFNSFELYIISGCITTITRNIFVAYMANKNYPYIKVYNKQKLEKKEIKDLKQNIFGMSLYKISSTVMNSTDNIIITTFINLTTTGIYSNYLLIVSNLRNAINTVFSSITSSVGNLCAEGNKIKSEFIFRCINFLNFWIYGFASICLWVLINPFIELWIGEQYTFKKVIVFVIILNFITDGLQQAVILYKDACGLFWKGKLRPVFSALLNIILSILLVQKFGILGVILGSVISRMITTWWFDAYLVYHNAFEMSPKKYYFRYFRSLIIIVFAAISIDLLMKFININLIINFFIKFVLCVIMPNIVFWICFRKSEEYNYLKSIVINKFINRRKN